MTVCRIFWALKFKFPSRYMKKVNKGFGSLVILHFTLTSFVISVLLFEILMVGNLTDSLRFAMHLLGWFVLLFLICYYGQLLIDEVNISDVSRKNHVCLRPLVELNALLQMGFNKYIVTNIRFLKLYQINFVDMKFRSSIK